MVKKKVLIIDSNRQFLLTRPIKIARSLSRNGYQVEFVMWDRTGNGPEVEILDGYKIHNISIKPMNNHVWGIILSYPLWWLRLFACLIRQDADIYHCENLYNLMPIIPLKIAWGKKSVYDIVDFTADSLNWPGYIRRFLIFLEGIGLRFADGIVVLDARKQQIKLDSKNLALVTNCPEDLLDELGPKTNKDQFIVYYGGWISETRGLRHLCEAINGIEGVKLVMAGFGPDKEKLVSLISAQGNAEFIGLVSDVESLKWTNTADAVFAFYDPNIPINRVAVSAKVYDAMMCGTPVITNSEAVIMSETIRTERCGLVTPYSDISSLREAIVLLKGDKPLREEMGKNGRRAFESKYNWSIMESNLIGLYSKIWG